MSWCAVDVRSPGDSRDAVASWLVGRTGQAVEERDDGTLVGFSETEAAAEQLLGELHARFGAGVDGRARALPQVDWSARWRDGLAPRAIGRLVVTPSWLASAASPESRIIIDPESAFGTGEHGSTRSALALLERHLQPGDRVLDLGSGSGILAIAAARLGAPAIWCGRLGRDSLGDLVEQTLRAAEVQTVIVRDSAPTGIMVKHERFGGDVHVDYHRA
ncbi:MAG TPA: 50S ribosomal protein L11 methyltransferase, partial [Gemmatimonadales bacterium]